jgi:hypothetical protein
VPFEVLVEGGDEFLRELVAGALGPASGISLPFSAGFERLEVLAIMPWVLSFYARRQRLPAGSSTAHIWFSNRW